MRKIKIGLLLIIFLIICSLATNVNAATTINPNTTGQQLEDALKNGGTIKFTYNDVVRNKYIFCREQQSTFNKGIDYTFTQDTSLSQVTYPDAQNKGAEWAYLIAKNYNSQNNINQANVFSNRTLQKIFWAAIGNSGNWTSNSLLNIGMQNPNNNSLIAEAISYGNFIRGSHNNVEYANTFIPEEIMEIENAAKPRTYGPFTVNPNYWIAPNGTLKAGITEFNISGVDNSGNGVYPHYTLEINNVTYGPYQGKITIENNSDVMMELNKKGKDGFNIHLEENIYSFQYEYSYKTIDATATFTPIASTFSSSVAQKLVVVNPKYEEKTTERESKVYIITEPEPNPQTAVILQLRKFNLQEEELSGARFTVMAKQKGQNLQIIRPNNVTDNSDIYSINVGKDSNGKVLTDNIYINIIEKTAPTGYETISKNINIVFSYNSQSGKFEPTFQPSRALWEGHGFANNTWGEWSWSGNADRDTTPDEWPNYYTSSGGDKIVVNQPETIKYEINVYDKQAPRIIFDIEKFDISDLEKDYSFKKEINNFEFEVTAKQSGKTILGPINVTYENSQSINILPLDRDRSQIDIEIKEINPPVGYNKLNSVIKFKYEYNTESELFEPVFENETWHADSQLENTFVSRSNDKYQVINNVAISLHKILVYNTPAPLKLKLNKLNSYYAGYEKPLKNAVFNIKAYQENESFNDNVTISSSNGQSSTQSINEGINVGANDIIEIYPNMVDENNKVYVNIQETGAPEGYKGLGEPIKLEYTYNNESYDWDLKIDDSLWLWVITNEDTYKDENETYTRNESDFPNVYCIYSNPDQADAITEQYLIEHKQVITDIIKVNDNEIDGGHIINVYNELEQSNINIDLIKLGFDIEENNISTIYDYRSFLTPPEFNITIVQEKQTGETEYPIFVENVIMQNLEYSFQATREDPIYVIIEETKQPAGFAKLNKPINIKYTYDDINGKWNRTFAVTLEDLQSVGLEDYWGNWQIDTTNESVYNYKSSEGDYIYGPADLSQPIKAYNAKKPVLDQIAIIKTDTNSEPIDDAIVDIEISNIDSYRRLDDDIQTTFSEGKQIFENVRIGYFSAHNLTYRNADEPIVVKIKETTPPEGYIGLDEEVTITIPASAEGNLTSSNSMVKVTQDDMGESRLINITVQNKQEPYTLSGRVWLDNSTVINNKTNSKPDGILNGSDELLEGIEVQLYDGKTKTQKQESVYTDANGYYQFTVEDNPSGYYVKFIYDGINYETINTRLRTYSGKFNTNDGKGGYEIKEDRSNFNNKFYYICKDSAFSKDGTENTDLEYIKTPGTITTSKLRTKASDTNLILEKYKMQAITDTYTKTTNNLNLALVKKETDIALTTSILTKNNLKIRDYLNSYTPSIYNSNSELNKPAVIVEGEKSYLIYKVDLINQSKERVNAEELYYYYDIENAKLHFEADRTTAINSSNNLEQLEIQYYENRYYCGVLNIKLNEDSILLPHASKTIYLVFEAATTDLNEGMQISNVVDLVKYSSNRSLIDKDSQPSNILDEFSTEDDLYVSNDLIKIN